MIVFVATPDTAWAAPLLALLRERGADARHVDDVVDALGWLRTSPAHGLVLDVRCGEDEVALGAASARRRAPSLAVVVAGPLVRELETSVTVVADPHAYVAIVDAALPGARRPPVIGPGNGGALANLEGPVTHAEVVQRLRIARFEPYAALLGVREGGSTGSIHAAADALLDRLAPGRVPGAVADLVHAELVELRAAIVDARDVLAARSEGRLGSGHTG
ncbi:MAG: hypothetical protein H6700_02740 [Myxococcales bacterium]|nr:hypothetical protein [Myxococcales bacterium]MCB9519619.1 hypothetical protein [Myxococcales bacterium]MCB9530657.1 hypothetical protein [Myxococcales bacterium]